MSAIESTIPEAGRRTPRVAPSAQQMLFEGGQPIRVMVDAEWRILRGSDSLAVLLDLDEAEVVASSIGRLLHPDDIAISPTTIARRSSPTSLRFRHGVHGYVRLDAHICSMGDGWQLSLCESEARILSFPR